MNDRASDEVLAEQAQYYRARAGEYDRWFLRQGRYDRGEEATRAWFDEIEEVKQALELIPIDGVDVLELAPGTGLWTELLAARAGSVVGLDASTEMIEENRRRLGPLASKVEFHVTDLFAWEPQREFDAVVFCFWISHVPHARLDDFLGKVARSLRVGGSVFFLDARREPTATAADHVLPDADEEVMTRRLDDGREFAIVKNFRDAADLVEQCRDAGLDVEVEETPTYFQYGFGRRVGVSR